MAQYKTTDKLFLETQRKVYKRDLNWNIHNFSTYFDWIGAEFRSVKNEPFEMSMEFMKYRGLTLIAVAEVKPANENEDIKVELVITWQGCLQIGDSKKGFNLLTELELQDSSGRTCRTIRLGSRNTQILSAMELIQFASMPFVGRLMKPNDLWDSKEIYFSDEILRMRFKLRFEAVETQDCTAQVLEGKQQRKLELEVLSNSFGKLLRSYDNANVKIICGGATLSAHKLILSTRSPVFARMLASDMVESRTSTIQIDDMTPSVVSRLLDYIYTGKVPVENWMIDQIIVIVHGADKYGLDNLRDICFKELVRKLEDENFGGIALCFHYFCHDPNYKKMMWDYCTKNWLTLRKDPKFVKLTRDLPDAFFDPDAY